MLTRMLIEIRQELATPLDNVRQEMLLRCVASGESGFFSRLEWLRPLGPRLGCLGPKPATPFRWEIRWLHLIINFNRGWFAAECVVKNPRAVGP